MSNTPTPETDLFLKQHIDDPEIFEKLVAQTQRFERQRDALMGVCAAALYDFEQFVPVLVDHCGVHPFTNTENALREAIADVKGNTES